MYRDNNQKTGIVGSDGRCLLCGSTDGSIIRGFDGKYRNICRARVCLAWFWPAPRKGYDTIEEARNPEVPADYSVERYLNGPEEVRADG